MPHGHGARQIIKIEVERSRDLLGVLPEYFPHIRVIQKIHDIAHDTRIDQLERQKISLPARAARTVPPQGWFETLIEQAMEFLANIGNTYVKGNPPRKAAVLGTTVSEPLRRNRETGYRTAKIILPFRVSADFLSRKCDMVEPRGIEPLTSSLRTTRSPS